MSTELPSACPSPQFRLDVSNGRKAYWWSLGQVVGGFGSLGLILWLNPQVPLPNANWVIVTGLGLMVLLFITGIVGLVGFIVARKPIVTFLRTTVLLRWVNSLLFIAVGLGAAGVILWNVQTTSPSAKIIGAMLPFGVGAVVCAVLMLLPSEAPACLAAGTDGRLCHGCGGSRNADAKAPRRRWSFGRLIAGCGRFAWTVLLTGSPFLVFGTLMGLLFVKDIPLLHAAGIGTLGALLGGLMFATFIQIARGGVPAVGSEFEGEVVRRSGLANVVRGLMAHGGFLILTDRAVRFASHGANAVGWEVKPSEDTLIEVSPELGFVDGETIPVELITSVEPCLSYGLVPNGLCIATRTHIARFVVDGRRAWVKAILTARREREEAIRDAKREGEVVELVALPGDRPLANESVAVPDARPRAPDPPPVPLTAGSPPPTDQLIRELSRTGAQWPAIWDALNPNGDPELLNLLIELRAPYLFAPGVALNMLLIGYERARSRSVKPRVADVVREAMLADDRVVR